VHLIRTIFYGLRDVWRDERVRGLLLFAFSMIALATVTFWLLEDWTLLDAAFFSVVTISTVGYGELVPQTVVGKLFAMFYILVGLGVFVAAASAVAEALMRRREQDRDRDP
jgi:voltage-gated potassium channel